MRNPLANPVGYVHNDTESAGKVARGACFATVSANKTFTLADLKVTGYTGTSSGKFVLQKREVDGSTPTENCFYWWDDTKHAAGWYNRTGQTAIDADNVDASSGTAFWVDGKGNKLVLPKVDIN